MHKLIDFVCDELEDIEQKASKGELSISDVQYADTLAHLKKNLLKFRHTFAIAKKLHCKINLFKRIICILLFFKFWTLFIRFLKSRVDLFNMNAGRFC